MPQNPDYSITGNSYFADNSVSFQVAFQNSDDQPLVQAYEWYLDNVLVTNAAVQNFAAQVSCGGHIISARVLYQSVWTGTQDFSFQVCRTVVSNTIIGPSQVDLGEDALYKVIREYSDGTSEDVTNLYTFSSSLGGSFVGNVFTATGDDSLFPPYGVTITATSGTETPLTKNITVMPVDTTSMGLLVVDFFGNSTLNIIGLVNNAEVAESHEAAYTGTNFIPVIITVGYSTILASDFIAQDVLNWRFEFNLHKLKNEYPGTDQFTFLIKGRGAAATSLGGAYTVYNPQASMIMLNSPGTYLPTVTGGTQLVSETSFTTNLVSGANGSYTEADLTLIIEFVYSVSANTVTYTT